MTESQHDREPEQGTGPNDTSHEQSGHATGFTDPGGRSEVDTGGANDDLHGQAREVAESAQGPGPGETPAG